MQKTTEKVRLSALTSAQTKITGVRPITKKTPKGINDQLNLQARARNFLIYLKRLNQLNQNKMNMISVKKISL